MCNNDTRPRHSAFTQSRYSLTSLTASVADTDIILLQNRLFKNLLLLRLSTIKFFFVLLHAKFSRDGKLKYLRNHFLCI